jgi:hypothetical protein
MIAAMKKTIDANQILALGMLLFLTVNLTGCGILRTGIASLKSTSDFHPLEIDNRVLAESGAEELAGQVAGYLPDAIRTVEKEQYRDFTRQVTVYVCASEDSFAVHTGLPKHVRGALITKVFLSARLKDPAFNETLKAILTHELSHLHLQQQLGVYHYNANIPAWFQEGLAVLVSNGGGAEKVSEAAAVKAIVEGKYFIPEAQGSFFWHKSGSSYGLEPHMFYRQAELFVRHLKRTSEFKFGLFMLAIADGGDFDKSFRATYGMSIDDMWQVFIEQLREKQREMRYAVTTRSLIRAHGEEQAYSGDGERPSASCESIKVLLFALNRTK